MGCNILGLVIPPTNPLILAMYEARNFFAYSASGSESFLMVAEALPSVVIASLLESTPDNTGMLVLATLMVSSMVFDAPYILCIAKVSIKVYL
jgi:hypothetical protein